MRRKIHLIIEDLNKKASLYLDSNAELSSLLIESAARFSELAQLEIELESNKLEIQRCKDLMHSNNLHL